MHPQKNTDAVNGEAVQATIRATPFVSELWAQIPAPDSSFLDILVLYQTHHAWWVTTNGTDDDKLEHGLEHPLQLNDIQL